MKTKFENDTRKVFHKIHSEQLDDHIFKRLVYLISTDYLQLDKDYFKGKICLDAGCGSTGNEIYSLLKLGAKKVYAFDLDETIYDFIPEKLQQFKDRYKLSIDNVLHTKYQNDYFDFVYCRGVLHHTSEPIFVGLKELKRITKPGGIIYFAVDGKGGLVDDIITLFRKKYQTEYTFRELIDNLTEKEFQSFIGFIFNDLKKHNDPFADTISTNIIPILFDKDLVLTIKDRIQAPVYTKTPLEDIMKWLNDNKFVDIIRLKSYPRYSNIRKFLAPLYYDYKNKYSQLLYGDGVIEIRATKGE